MQYFLLICRIDTNTMANSWLTQNLVSFPKSFGVWACGSTKSSCRFNFGKAHRDHRVRLNSGSGSSVANWRFSYEIFSRGRWFQANNTAIWKVVTSTSKRPTWFENVIWNNITVLNETIKLRSYCHLWLSLENFGNISFLINVCHTVPFDIWWYHSNFRPLCFFL